MRHAFFSRRKRWRVPLLATLVSMPARDAEAGLRFVAPDECPSEAEMASRAKSLESADKHLRDATVRVERKAGKLVAEIRFDEGAPRTFEADTCSAIAEGTLVVLSLNLAPGPPAAREVETPRVRAPETYEPPPPLPEKPAPERSRPWFVGIAPLVDLGTLPRATPGAELRFGLSFPHLRVEVAVHGLLPVGISTSSAARASFDAFGLGARAAWLFGDEVRFGGGIGAAVVRFGGASTGAELDGTASVWTLAPEAFALADFRLSKVFHVTAQLGALAPLTRPAFVLDGLGEVQRPSPVLGRAALGMDVHF